MARSAVLAAGAGKDIASRGKQASDPDEQPGRQRLGLECLTADRPSWWQDKEAFRAALNVNPVLGILPCVRRASQPTYFERVWLFGLYLITGLLVEHLSLLYGPICREAYTKQCGLDLFEQALIDEGSNLTDPVRLLADQSQVSQQVLEATSVAGLRAREELSSARESVIDVLSGQMPQLNCNLTMCDHWEKEQTTHARSPEGKQVNYEAFLFNPGLCRCDRTYAQKVTYKIATAVVSVVVQTVIYTTFHEVLAQDWEGRGFCLRALNKMFMLFLSLVMVAELVVIFLIRFMPEAWLISLSVSAVSVMTLSFAVVFFKVHFGWQECPQELREPAEESEEPLKEMTYAPCLSTFRCC